MSGLNTELARKRYAIAEHLIACADTVTLLRADEVLDTHNMANAGEFDDMLDWRSPYLGRKK